jgi:hypothetical protein
VAGLAEMVCDLVHVPLDGCPELWAISYCWGSPQEVFYLSFSDGTYIQISETVDALLKHVIGGARDMMLWIDAICIDQQNNMEDCEQIGIMQDIYATASIVLVWVARMRTARVFCGNGSDVITETMKIFNQDRLNFVKSDIPGEIPAAFFPLPPASDEEWALELVKLNRFLNKPWCSRT